MSEPLKILTAKQTALADQATIKNRRISSLDLMEHAATQVYNRLQQLYPDKTIPWIILAGCGNNGGDGLVIARLLAHQGYSVTVYRLLHSQRISPENQANFERLPQHITVHSVPLNDWQTITFPTRCYIVDALLGVGISKGVASPLGDFFAALNQQQKAVIAIDMPSGLSSEVIESSEKIDNNKAIIQAQRTFTFNAPKISLLHPIIGKYTGELEVIDIGLDTSETAKVNEYYLTKSFIRSLIQPISAFAHKGTQGHAYLIGGSEGKSGAITLACKACLRSGTGLVTALTAKSCYTTLQTSCNEAMVQIVGDTHIEPFLATELGNAQAIVMGPGLGKQTATIQATKQLLETITRQKIPCLLDADALNIIAEYNYPIPTNAVLTPHPKEFSRLYKKTINQRQLFSIIRNFSIDNQCILVYKGRFSIIAEPSGTLFFNSTGNSGMATAGCGDVLSGIIGGLLAQNYSPLNASLIGTFLHGLAGDIAAKELHPRAMIATDVINHLSKAWLL